MEIYVCQDCLFHLAYLLKIEIYAKISFSIHIENKKKCYFRFFKRSRKKIALLRALEYCALLNRKRWKNMPQNNSKRAQKWRGYGIFKLLSIFVCFQQNLIF